MSEANRQQLPAGWGIATVGALVGFDGVFCDGDWVESKDQDPLGDVRLIQLADVGDGDYRNRSKRFLTTVKATELRCTFINRGDLLVARMPDPLGRVCVFPGDLKHSVTVVDVCIIRLASPASSRWLMHQLNTPQVRGRIAELKSGTTRERISRANLATVTFPVPPLREQERIAARLDELLSDLDAGVAALERVQAKLKHYRAALLKAAVEGALTAGWRAQHPDTEPASDLLHRILVERCHRWEEAQLEKLKAAGREPPKDWKAKYQDPADPDTTNLPPLPDGWCWATVEQLSAPEANSITDGPFGSNLMTAHYTDSGPRVIRLQNIKDGSFADERAHIAEARFAQLKKHAVQAGDIVIAGLSESPPRACIIPDSVGPAIVKADCIRFKPHKDLSADCLCFFLNSIPTRMRMKQIVHGVGRPRLNLGEIRAIALPLAPIPEEEVISGEVEDQLSVIDHLEADLDAKLKSAQALRQSILRHAFTGQLVPQDQNDEPASELLKRIAAEREERTRQAAAAKQTTKKVKPTKARAKTPRRRQKLDERLS